MIFTAFISRGGNYLINAIERGFSRFLSRIKVLDRCRTFGTTKLIIKKRNKSISQTKFYLESFYTYDLKYCVLDRKNSLHQDSNYIGYSFDINSSNPALPIHFFKSLVKIFLFVPNVFLDHCKIFKCLEKLRCLKISKITIFIPVYLILLSFFQNVSVCLKFNEHLIKFFQAENIQKIQNDFYVKFQPPERYPLDFKNRFQVSLSRKICS